LASQLVTLSSTISGPAGSGAPSGTVTFSDGTTVLGTATLNSSGQAKLQTSALTTVGVHTITAAYSGDDAFKTSTSAAVSQIVYAYPAGGGSFVIGDLDGAVGTEVTFWGAQWAKLNSLSDGSAPSSFKGFASSTGTTPAAVNGTWTTGPGNSSGAPASIPAYMGVIVTSSASKSGSAISGNIVNVVVVKTDAGYAGDPGHAGTGTVVAVAQ
jgi:hypothetical protein